MAIASVIGSSRNADNTASIVTPSRTGSYLEAYAIELGGAKNNTYAEEGSYFSTYNVTDGTGIAGHAAPVQADLSTKPFIHLFNSSATKSITIDIIRIRMTAIGAGATTTDATFWVDNNAASSRTSAGTLATIVNCNSASTSAAVAASIWCGPVVSAIGTGEVRVDHQRLRSVVPVAEDQYVFQFGGANQSFPAAQPLSGTLIVSAYCSVAPCVVPPLGNFKFVMWGASQSGAHSAEYTIGFWQR